MADQKIKPAKGLVLVKFLEDLPEPNTPGKPNSPPESRNESVLATVVAVGREVEAKAGDTVLVRSWAVHDSLKFSDMNLVDSYAIAATISD